ncbi:hypothetical protein AQUCO_00300546v1 [Aquilegia coerulea]|uniref:Uncharacterized protein n=1 Tax=Aquilegia coerulea TaxID=218851 RepID=A0A2G5EZC5_AQUCA|nr:hypothetical protein AQUCO_00300546v1 [Aquilegia coerulea]
MHELKISQHRHLLRHSACVQAMLQLDFRLVNFTWKLLACGSVEALDAQAPELNPDSCKRSFILNCNDKLSPVSLTVHLPASTAYFRHLQRFDSSRAFQGSIA